jgi:hypothetical protein
VAILAWKEKWGYELPQARGKTVNPYSGKQTNTFGS